MFTSESVSRLGGLIAHRAAGSSLTGTAKPTKHAGRTVGAGLGPAGNAVVTGRRIDPVIEIAGEER